MIPVAAQPEPADFDANVRAKGLGYYQNQDLAFLLATEFIATKLNLKTNWTLQHPKLDAPLIQNRGGEI